jgi:hypothetical protein
MYISCDDIHIQCNKENAVKKSEKQDSHNFVSGMELSIITCRLQYSIIGIHIRTVVGLHHTNSECGFVGMPVDCIRNSIIGGNCSIRRPASPIDDDANCGQRVKVLNTY